MTDLNTIPYVECRYWTRGHVRSHVDLVVLHDMESPETVDRAERCAAWMAGKLPGQEPHRASAHYFVDCNSIVQGVREDCIAWHAPGVNSRAIGIEHAGRARQTREEWLDPYGLDMLELSAQLVADVCKRWGLPISFVDAPGILAGRRGITMHRTVTEAYPDKGTHQDPGPNFPLDEYLARVLRASVAQAQTKAKGVLLP